MPDRRELYRSPNGDTWFLGREPTSGHAFIIHQPNAPSGVDCPALSWGVLAQWEWAGTTSIVAPDRNAGGGATLCLERVLINRDWSAARVDRCPLYPRKRTCAVQLGMSAKGQ